jgi:hypothetical protein
MCIYALVRRLENLSRTPLLPRPISYVLYPMSYILCPMPLSPFPIHSVIYILNDKSPGPHSYISACNPLKNENIALNGRN